ncbi:MAG: hypothetical protein M9948_12255 [Lentimicrobium sp.]|nr:hypothetical protein [Lentimicrobium sp.]HPG32789.1 hypothetical protein [Lentimicrobium sp.]
MRRLLMIALSITMFTACQRTHVKKELYEDGTLKSEKTYEKVNGKEVLVKEVDYHPNGQKYMEGGYVNELREGYWASWYKSGSLWSEGEFKAGESNGKRTVYFENGKIYYTGYFNMGKRSGTWTFFDEDGEKINEIVYDSIPQVKK